jgi:hypothetical protein
LRKSFILPSSFRVMTNWYEIPDRMISVQMSCDAACGRWDTVSHNRVAPSPARRINLKQGVAAH